MADYSKYDDGDLLAPLRKSDHSAFTEIYNRYHKKVYAYILGYTKDTMLTEDLLHEVFMKLWEIRERMVIKASFSAYLFRICHNMSINAIKRIASDDRLRQNTLKHLQTFANAELSDPAELKHYDRLLEKALDSLPPQRRKVFVLCRQEGKTYDEAAAELGISRNTVKEHMAKAMRSLREFLSDNGEIAFALILLEKLF